MLLVKQSPNTPSTPHCKRNIFHTIKALYGSLLPLFLASPQLIANTFSKDNTSTPNEIPQQQPLPIKTFHGSLHIYANHLRIITPVPSDSNTPQITDQSNLIIELSNCYKLLQPVCQYHLQGLRPSNTPDSQYPSNLTYPLESYSKLSVNQHLSNISRISHLLP